MYIIFYLLNPGDLGLTPKEEALLTEIRKRKSELLDEIQVLSHINLNVNLNRSFVITFGVFTASSLTDRQQIILQLN